MWTISVPSSSYDPKALKLFSRALEEAWETAQARNGLLGATVREGTARQVLARSILVLAATGERDLEELKRYALRDLSVRAWRRTLLHTEAA